MTNAESDEVAVYELQWTPTIADWERALRAKRRASKVVWLERLFGVLFVLLGLPSLLQGDLSTLPLVFVGVTAGTGLWRWTQRRLFYWPQHKRLLVPSHTWLYDESILEMDDQESARASWQRWPALVPLDDMLVLLDAPKGGTMMHLLAKRGLDDETQWPALVDFVAARVPLHPKLKGR